MICSLKKSYQTYVCVYIFKANVTPYFCVKVNSKQLLYDNFLQYTERVERGEGAAAADDQGQPRLRGQTGRHPQAETQIKD